MTNEEFLDLVPWHQGIAQGALSAHRDSAVSRQASRLFWLSPRYFAMAELARKHPDEFAQLVTECEKQACERYGVESWASQEPKG